MSIAIVKKKDCDIKDLISRAIILENVPNAEDKLKRWLRTSDQVWLGMHDDKVACIWGVGSSSAISNRAYLWLLTTDIVDEHKFLFVRHSQMVLKEALEEYPQIIGHVEMHNERAKKWLKWLGAKFGEPQEGYMPFYYWEEVMAFAVPLMMVATAIGAGVSAFGMYQQGQMTAEAKRTEALNNQTLAGIAAQNANYDIMSGEVKAQQAGLVSRAALGRIGAFAGARNIAGASLEDTKKSQLAIGQENEAIQRADAAHAAYGEQVQAAEKTATASGDLFAARSAIASGDIGAIGAGIKGVTSVIGEGIDAGKVSPKWYENV